MANEATVHEKALERRREILEWAWGKERVFFNLDGAKNKEINGMYPDLVVFDRKGENPIIIEEVETENSINEESAEKKWIPYSGIDNAQFRLVVPRGMKERAMRIVEEKGIASKVVIKEY